MRLLAALLVAGGLLSAAPRTVVIISANAEWKEAKRLFPSSHYLKQPYGEYFQYDHDTLVVQGGWGKISAAASAQYVVDRWHPKNIINLGTCGGIAGRIERYAIVAVSKTIVYDIIEQMGDSAEAIQFYSTDIDLAWAGAPLPSTASAMPLLSADRDLVAGEIATLVKKYDARVVDWESGAIAWTARRNGIRVVILRGVSDLVGEVTGGQAYGNTGEFEQGTARVMKDLFDALPKWLAKLH